MGLIAGAAACARFNVVSLPETLDFELVPFRPILPGSSLREREGFVPFEPGEPYEIGARKWAFRMRVDKVSLDATVVRERMMELIKAETESVGPPSPKVRQQLKLQVEMELMEHPMPRSKIVECVIDDNLLYVGTTGKTHLGTVLELLKRIGVEAEFKTPWLDAGQEEEPSEHVELKEPGQSLWGCRFLKKLLNDPDVFVEPENGSVKLVAPDGVKVSLAGPVLNELDRYLEDGSEMLSARLMIEDFNFSFDALSYRINGLKLDTIRNKHWTETLDIRMEKLRDLFDWLDAKYRALMLS